MTRRAALGSIDDAPGPGDGVRGAEVEGRGDAIGANTDHPGPGDGVRGAGIGGSGDALGRNADVPGPDAGVRGAGEANVSERWRAVRCGARPSLFCRVGQ